MQTSGEPDTRLESFRDVSMEFDAVYGMLAKSCGLSGTTIEPQPGADPGTP